MITTAIVKRDSVEMFHRGRSVLILQLAPVYLQFFRPDSVVGFPTITGRGTWTTIAVSWLCGINSHRANAGRYGGHGHVAFAAWLRYGRSSRVAVVAGLRKARRVLGCS
jgi:hypothetical protein